MAREHLLVIEDEADLLELLRYNLAKEGYQVTAVESGEEGLRRARETRPDLVLLDLMLPGLDGFEVCKALKRNLETEGIPVVMLTARQEEADMVAGLELGADDYITKPFSPRVLKARIKAVLRRKSGGETEENELLRRGELVIDNGRHEVKLAGESVSLTYTEFGLLRLLAGRPGWVFDRYQILDSIKGDDYDVTDRSVDVHIASLRKKLGAWGKHIETVRGVGYRFRE